MMADGMTGAAPMERPLKDRVEAPARVLSTAS
ncbi:hypothetical protein C5N14_29760 [Micromonospora sp. MW-13]|nr:hypothetical protein C5N14_29760 [Micromonospora sp. MW-13]